MWSPLPPTPVVAELAFAALAAWPVSDEARFAAVASGVDCASNLVEVRRPQNQLRL